MVEEMDQDLDGFEERPEDGKAKTVKVNYAILTKEEEDQIKEIFDIFDKESTNRIECKDLASIMRWL